MSDEFRNSEARGSTLVSNHPLERASTVPRTEGFSSVTVAGGHIGAAEVISRLARPRRTLAREVRACDAARGAMWDAGEMSGETIDTVSAKGDDVSCERASGVQDLSSEMSRQIACTSGAAHAAASGGGRRKGHSSVCRWTLPDFTKTRARQVWSDFQTVAGRECRLLVYPKGDSMALPGFVSAYLQVDASARERASRANGGSARTAAAEDWECFVSYELAVVRPSSDDASAGSAAAGEPAEAGARRDSWHRFSARKKSHGWCDFARSAVVLDARNGYLVDDALTVEARIIFLDESSELVVEGEKSGAGGASGDGSTETTTNGVPRNEPPLTGRFTWTVENLSHFAAMIKTQKVMSPSFVVGDCAFRLSAYQSSVARKEAGREKKRREDAEARGETPARGDDVECLSLCLESKEIDTISGDKAGALSARTAALGAGAGAVGAGRVSKVAGDVSSAAGVAASRSCWLVFRVSAVHQRDGKKSVHRDSYGRFAGDALGGDTTSLGWNDFMPMATFAGGADAASTTENAATASGSDASGSATTKAPSESTGFLEGPDGRAVFSVSFHAVREACEARTHHRRADRCSGPATVVLSPDGSVRAAGGGVPEASRAAEASSRRKEKKRGALDPSPYVARARDGVSGKGHPFAGHALDVVGRFVWRLDNFTKLKDILKKRKMSGLSVKSRRFVVGGRRCRLIVYPRGQSHPPNHLSMFLEVTDPDAPDDVFVSHRLSVCNQLDVKKSVSRESQNRYGRGAKDWGWREFLTLTTLFDEDAGFLVNDTVVFTAEVSILRERVEFGSIPRNRLPPPTNQMRFNPRRLARFIARYGLEEKEAEAARFLFGDRFEEVKAAALARAERAAARAPRDTDAGKPKLELDALLATDIRDARTREAKRRALRGALGGPEEYDGSLETAPTNSDSGSDSDSDADAADLEDVHIQTPSLAQMAYVKTATEAKLPVASRLVTDRGMAPLEGEGVNVAFNWRVELFAAFKDVLETKKIYSRFFCAAPGVDLRLGVYESWETLCVYLEPESCVAGASLSSGWGGGDDASRGGAKNHWVRYRLGLVNQRDARKTVWKENSTCTRTRWTSQVSQFVKMHELMDPENGFVVKDTVVIACEVLDCCPWFDERQLSASAEGAEPEGAEPGARTRAACADGEDDRSAAAAVEALTETLSSAGIGNAVPGLADSREEEEEGSSSKKKRRGGGGGDGGGGGGDGGGGALANVLGLGGLGLDAFQSELLDKDLSRLRDGEALAEFAGSAGKPSGLRPPLSESLRQNDLLRAALKSSGLDAAASLDVSPRSFPPSEKRSGDVEPGPNGAAANQTAFSAERSHEADATKRGLAFDRLFRAAGVDVASDLESRDGSAPKETETALLRARRALREALEANPSARDAFPAAIRGFLSTRGAVDAAARECVAGIPPGLGLSAGAYLTADPVVARHPGDANRHRLAVLCGCDVLRGAVYERLLSSLLAACGALNEARNATERETGNPRTPEEALFDARVLLCALTRLCDLADLEASLDFAEGLDTSVAPSAGAEATRARLAQVLNAPWPSGVKLERGGEFHPRLVLAARLKELVPRSARASAAGRSLVAPLLEGALGGYADDGFAQYFEALRFLSMHDSDESVAFAKCVAAIASGSPRVADATNADSLVAEAVDFAFFVAAKRERRAEEGSSPAEANVGAAAESGAHSFAEATRAALDGLEKRAARRGESGLRDIWRFQDSQSVIDSVRYWMTRHGAVADVVAERLAATFVASAPASPLALAADAEARDDAAGAPPHAKEKETKKEKTKAERRAAAREAAEREADARELAAINAVVGKAAFAGRDASLRRSDGTRETRLRAPSGPLENADADAHAARGAIRAEEASERERRERASRAEALAPLAVVSFAQSAADLLASRGGGVGAAIGAARAPSSATFRAALEAHPETANAARRYARYVCLELDEEGNPFYDDDIGQARVLGVAAVAAAMATPETSGGSTKSRARDDEAESARRRETATRGVLAFADALAALAERHAQRDEDTELDAQERRRAAREYATLCDALAELLASETIFSEASPTSSGSATKESAPAKVFLSTRDLLTRVLASALAGGGAAFFARLASAEDDDATLEALGARDDDEAWAARREKETLSGSVVADPPDGPDDADGASASTGFVLDAALVAAHVARSGAARLRAAREDAARAEESAATAAARAAASARKLESDAAKLSRDKKTIASARAETELKAKRVADEARLQVSKIERERDEMREKARDAERAGDWARDEANELRRTAEISETERKAAETRARDAEERMKRRDEEHRRTAEQAKRRGDELEARLRGAESRARDAERRLAEMEKREERRKRSDADFGNDAKAARLEFAKLAGTLAAERARADRAERELAETRKRGAFFRDGARQGHGAASAGGVGAGPGADADGRRGLRAAPGAGAIGGDAFSKEPFGAPPGFSNAFSNAPFADAKGPTAATAPIGPPGEIADDRRDARTEPAAGDAGAPFGAPRSLFGLGGLPLGGLGNGTWSGDGDTWR